MEDTVEEDFEERISRNQRNLSSDSKMTFDYIVCGAGTSGCVVAARLAADLNTLVLLLEAGGNDDLELVSNPRCERGSRHDVHGLVEAGKLRPLLNDHTISMADIDTAHALVNPVR